MSAASHSGTHQPSLRFPHRRPDRSGGTSCRPPASLRARTLGRSARASVPCATLGRAQLDDGESDRLVVVGHRVTKLRHCKGRGAKTHASSCYVGTSSRREGTEALRYDRGDGMEGGLPRHKRSPFDFAQGRLPTAGGTTGPRSRPRSCHRATDRTQRRRGFCRARASD
jgi:hypothetical protein